MLTYNMNEFRSVLKVACGIIGIYVLLSICQDRTLEDSELNNNTLKFLIFKIKLYAVKKQRAFLYQYQEVKISFQCVCNFQIT